MQERAARRPDSQAGFTLLETLVAVLVLAALVSVVPRTLVAARNNLERSEDWLSARLVAETVLNEALVGPSLTAGIIGGDVDGRRWSATLRQVNSPDGAGADSDRVLLDVSVRVTVSGRRSLEVETMRIGVAQ